MTEPIAYLNGELVPQSEAKLPVYDAGIVLGATVTEMIRTFGHRPFKLEEHVARLYRSMRYVRFETELTRQEMLATTLKVIEHNAALLPKNKELGIIQFVTAGTCSVYAGSAGGGEKMIPTVCIHTFPLPLHLWAKGFETGLHAVTPSNRHIPPQCIDPKMKYRSRLHYWLAEQEAKAVDPNAATLLLDLDGNVTEFSGGNILIVKNGAIVSPTTRNILPGISRQTVIELASELQIPFFEKDFQVYDVCNAEEAFEATTPFCLMPVTKINNIPIGNGKPGPICFGLLDAWAEKVGVDIVGQIKSDSKWPAQQSKPYSFGGKFFIREGASSQQMSRDEIREFFFAEGLIHFDETPCPNYDVDADLTPEIWSRFATRAKLPSNVETESALRNLHLAKSGKMTHAGAWLLCNDITRFTLRAGVTCAVFRGATNVHILDRRDLTGSSEGSGLNNQH